jgi:hypothetical protein
MASGTFSSRAQGPGQSPKSRSRAFSVRGSPESRPPVPSPFCCACSLPSMREEGVLRRTLRGPRGVCLSPSSTPEWVLDYIANMPNGSDGSLSFPLCLLRSVDLRRFFRSVPLTQVAEQRPDLSATAPDRALPEMQTDSWSRVCTRSGSFM